MIEKKINEDKTNAQFQIKFGLSSGRKLIKIIDNTGIIKMNTKSVEKILPESLILRIKILGYKRQRKKDASRTLWLT
jgi:hypothetical protein